MNLSQSLHPPNYNVFSCQLGPEDRRQVAKHCLYSSGDQTCLSHGSIYTWRLSLLEGTTPSCRLSRPTCYILAFPLPFLPFMICWRVGGSRGIQQVAKPASPTSRGETCLLNRRTEERSPEQSSAPTSLPEVREIFCQRKEAMSVVQGGPLTGASWLR